MSNIEEVKARIDIVDLVSEAGVKLRHSGKNYTGFCPFHANTRTPAFVVFPETGTWRCFGQCNEGGDIFKFVMKKEGWDFPEALRYLAERAGVQLETYSPAQEVAREEHERLRALLEDAVTYFRGHLLSPAGAAVLAYLREKRALSDATIEAFGLGYAPPGWDNLLKHFTGRGASQQDLFDAGLLSERESGGHYDRFRNRIMIPIRDANGRMAGFGARIVDPDDVPKFLNSPQTATFDKGRLLYGLDRARKPIRAADQAVIVEGYLDVIALHQAGYENAVSPMGTALTEDQLRLLKRLSRRIILALDPDAAGQHAVLRGLQAARQALDRESELAFDARGLLRNEARLQADLRVASLPDGLDPDEIVARDRDEWARLMEASQPIVTHVMTTLAEGQDLNDPKVKTSIAGQVLPLIEDLPDPLERDTFRQQLARLLRVDERSLPGGQAASRPARRYRPRPSAQEPAGESQTGQAPVQTNPVRKMELYCLGVLYQHPGWIYRLDRILQEDELPALDEEDFEYTEHQMLFRLLRQASQQDGADPQRFVEQNLPATLAAVHEQIAAAVFDTKEDRLFLETRLFILNLRLGKLQKNNEQLRFLMEDAQAQGTLLSRDYMELGKEYQRIIGLIHKASANKGVNRTSGNHATLKNTKQR